MPLDPTIVQQLPTATLDSTDVGAAVVSYLSKTNRQEVAADHESRIAFGEKKYGQRLKINNGRDALMDAYQELLDFLSYAMQAHLEGDGTILPMFDAVSVFASELRGRLNNKEGATHIPGMEPCNKVTFVPNQAGASHEEVIQEFARRFTQDPSNITTVPFSELSTWIKQEESNFSAGGSPVRVDVFGEVSNVSRFEKEPVIDLGEQLVKELDSFEESPSSADIVNLTMVFSEGSDHYETTPKTVVDSEATLTRLENTATGKGSN